VEVTDDGHGIDGSALPGVGIGSMHARAEALGGEVTIGRSGTGGTAVRARLPLS
jgi:signal transduction histidine kinase